MIIFIYSSTVLLFVTMICLQWYCGIRKMPFITREPDPVSTDEALVSVIIAAKDEETEIESTLRSLMAQSYTNLEVIAVNDRSDDRTGAILDRLRGEFPALQVIHIHELPTGWLGKNHALYKGYEQSRGDWLLYADADILFSEKAVADSLYFARTKSLDHLALLPENRGGTLPYRIFYTFWGIIGVWNFIAAGHAGVGAFNLMKRDVYKHAGTHKAIALRPDDDLKLGKTIVDAGYKQQLGFGNGIISIQWYETLKDMSLGLEKNLFAFMQYRLSFVLLATAGVLSFHVTPFILVFHPDVIVQLLSAAVVVLYVLMYVKNGRYFSHPWWYVCTVPFSALVFLYCLWRSMIKAYKNGGVEWRGTKYSLKELRQKK
ncbi:glycosyltransferase [Alteribacter keqinensis]|uniref:Glycosyltransferase n=1 Tax=Alteribacter keqinensis TaxID=2483800 RepID=A0A3M7TQ78_9BACI|nr:glycosyltransferase family A protein [Alteribacter keqinensis]RNA66829.1 glycosyltransferase [Alteribacter keqinensis]